MTRFRRLRDPRSRAGLAALLVFGLAAILVYGELWREGPRSFVPLANPRGAKHPTGDRDILFQTWLVARHARTLVTRPLNLFDTEHCFPTEKTLTLSLPMLTMGLFAVPAYLATWDPILTYNVTLVLLTVAAALAMYWLVASWTGVPAAGIVAGLLYAFHPVRFRQITHPTEVDTIWIVVALAFAQRLFSRGRWTDAVGLAAAIALQIGSSFYTLLVAFFLTPPFLVWLLVRHRLEHVRVAHLAFILGVTLLATAVVLVPYLGADVEGGMHRPRFIFAPLWRYLPGQSFFLGWTALSLAIVGLAVRRTTALAGIEGDPRPALVAGAVIVAWAASGPHVGTTLARWLPDFVPDEPLLRLFNLQALLAPLLPGLDTIRSWVLLSSGPHLVGVLIAGLGAAALIRRSGRRGLYVSIALTAVAAWDMLRLPSFGFEHFYALRYVEARPSDEEVEFFEELERLGNRGPLLELPMNLYDAARPILLTAYHHRRTSSCLASYRPRGYDELEERSRRLPERETIDALIALGFTTVVIRTPAGPTQPWRTRLRLDAAHREGLERIHATGAMAAYALRPESGD